MTASAATGAATLTGLTAHAAESASAARDYYELRQYLIDTEEQRKGLDAFLRDAAIPAVHRLGIRPVGVFYPREGLSPVYVLIRHKSLDSLVTLRARLWGDSEFLAKGAAFLDAPADKPAYKRVESSLLVAFKGMPELETPIRSPGRVLQLRIYESPSVKTGQKKIEMFNDAGEIKIFRAVGLHPVFFGETLVGAKMPNLTYLLVFESEEQLKANWDKFRNFPDWLKLRAMPEYADKAILSPGGITNLVLKPAPYSEI